MSKSKQLNHSNQWHVDETVVKLNGQKYYLWAAFKLFNDLNEKYDNPELIVKDLILLNQLINLLLCLFSFIILLSLILISMV